MKKNTGISKATTLRQREMTSFCCNCGKVVRYGVGIDDPALNRETCTICAPLLVKFVEADINEQLADEELTKAIADKLPDGVLRTVSGMSKKEITEAQAAKRVALAKLRKRRMEIGTILKRLAKWQ